MNFFVNTVSNYIFKQIEHFKDSNEKLIITLPSYNYQIMEALGESLDSRLIGKNVELIYKIARPLWENQNISKDKIKKAFDNNWLDNDGNLTRYRNQEFDRNKYDKCLIILGGVDLINDSASLADFHSCSSTIIWNSEEGLNRSFSAWIEILLDENSIAYELDTIKEFDKILKALVERLPTDIVQISSFLEAINLSGVQDGKDFLQRALSSLEFFNLPDLSGFINIKKKNIGPYIDSASSFVSYSMFIDETNRKKFCKKIKDYKDEKGLENFLSDENKTGSYSSDNKFLDALYSYVEKDDQSVKKDLIACDFITIKDKILKFKPATKKSDTATKKETIKKLDMDPLESILSGIWITLSKFKKDAEKNSLIAKDQIKEIKINSEIFEHDFEGGSALDSETEAKSFLKVFLGGLDVWFNEPERIFIKNDSLEDNKVKIDSNIFNDNIHCQYKANKEPNLVFSVKINSFDEEIFVEKKYLIRIPDISPYKISKELFDKVFDDLKQAKNSAVLPVFFVPFYDELMLSKDSLEANRVLMQAIRNSEKITIDLLKPISDELKNEDSNFSNFVRKLGFEFCEFVQNVCENGLYYAVSNKSSWSSLRQTFIDLFDCFLDEKNNIDNDFGTILHRLFFIVKEKQENQIESWVWDKFENSAVATILHPSVLEMFQAKIIYLFECFNYESNKNLNSPKRNSFQIKAWDYYLDLSTIKMPLCGLIKSQDVFDSSVRGEDLIHILGSIDGTESSLSTRIILKYDNFDEDIKDYVLFKETRESKLIYRIITDFLELYPHANDGLNISVFQNLDIQPLIAAIDKFMKEKSNNISLNYNLNITIFSETADDRALSNWIEEWRERWEVSEVEESLAHYRNCNLKLSHRIVKSDNNYEQFKKIINENFDCDIIILSNFIGTSNENRFEEVDSFDVTSRPLKYPILEKIFCSSTEKRNSDTRERVISNRQFTISTKHLGIMASMKNMKKTSYIAIGSGDFSPWNEVVNALHKKAEWVVCIDSNIDERLLQDDLEKNSRKIIGFGSGVGSHGEANYTISTEQFKLTDLKKKLRASISNIMSGWEHDDYEKAAEFAIKQSENFSGLSLIKSTGLSQEIRNLLAYAYACKIYNFSENILCSKFISLDAYRHWFEAAESNIRPDILLLNADINESGLFSISAMIIECKFAENTDGYLDKAFEQIINGLDTLIPAFMPFVKNNENNYLLQRPDARYWWLQLHRLIASKTQVKKKKRKNVLEAFEKLAEGEFEISWGGSILTCSSGNKTDVICEKESWNYYFEGKTIKISEINAGSYALRKLCFDNNMSFEFNFDFTKFIRQESESEEFESYGNDEKHELNIEEENIPDIESSGKLERVRRETNKNIDSLVNYREFEGKNNSNVFEPKIPERIFLGTSVNGSRDVYWEYGNEDLSNRHMLIFGSSGMGKTYAIQCFLNEFGKNNQNSLVIDYTNGFLPEHLEKETKKFLEPKQHYIMKEPLPISPFKIHAPILDGEAMPEKIGTASKRITSIFDSVYNFGDQQYSVLLDAISDGILTYGNSFNLDNLLEILKDYLEDKIKQKNSVLSLISKIKPFILDNPFSSEFSGISWDHLFEKKNQLCNIFQLAGMDLHSWKLVTEFLLWDFYAFVRGTGNKNNPKVIVLDEVQNLNHREEFPLAKYLTEGRKFGISLILATQTLSNLSAEERSRLFQAGHKLFFKPADTEISEYSKLLENATSEPAKFWTSKLSQLKKGECYSLGPSLNDDNQLVSKVFKISVTSMKQRGF
ncbi:MAG: type IV secretion system DNA-binding domain-containing protein [Desulforegulaceae bacterium]|nr:type IV secretion system DNA-binding domain-containing protein [Desulforegulaceae bacterium]